MWDVCYQAVRVFSILKSQLMLELFFTNTIFVTIFLNLIQVFGTKKFIFLRVADI